MILGVERADAKWQKWTLTWSLIIALSGIVTPRKTTRNEYFRRYSFFDAGFESHNPLPVAPAGILFRITQNGMDHISSAVQKGVAYVLPQLSLRDLAVAEAAGIRVNLVELRVLSFHSFGQFRMMLQPNAEDQIRVSDTDINLSLLITIATNRRAMRSVTFAVHASNVAYDIGFTLSGRQNGELMVAVGSCDINVQRVRVTTEELHGSRLVWNFVKSLLRSSLRHFINRKLCKLLRNHVTEEVKSHLKITGKQKLLHGDFHNIGITETIGGYRHGNSSYNAIFMQKLDKAFHQLYMNTGLVESPSTDRKGSTVFINIPVNGEIYAPGYRNNVGRNVMSEIDMHRNKMLYIGINEFVINTLLSSLYHMDAMNFTLNSVNTPKLEDFLQTDCEDFCLGTFLPEVADAHPGRAFSLLMVADRAPAASFDVQGIQIKLTAVITVQVDAPGSKIPVMRADVRMRATVSLRVRNQKLHGTAEVNEFDLKPREKLNLGKDAVELMNEVPGKVIEAELNNILDKGIQLPTLDLFSLRNVAITHVLKGIWMELDFNFNFDAVAKLIKNILKHPNSHY